MTRSARGTGDAFKNDYLALPWASAELLLGDTALHGSLLYTLYCNLEPDRQERALGTG